MEVIDGLYEKAENVLPMEGPLAIPARAAIGAALGWLVIAAWRPSFAYDDANGKPRPWATFPQLYEGSGQATCAPWFIGPLTGAVLLSVFL